MAATGLNGLLTQLAPNAPPPPPSAWPPGPLAWLLAGLVIAGLIAVMAWVWRRRRRFRYLRALRRLRRRPASVARLTAVHALLRNAGGAPVRTLPPDAFAERVADTLGLARAPAWVNAHYRRRRVTMDWRQARRLIKRWCPSRWTSPSRWTGR